MIVAEREDLFSWTTRRRREHVDVPKEIREEIKMATNDHTGVLYSKGMAHRESKKKDASHKVRPMW